MSKRYSVLYNALTLGAVIVPLEFANRIRFLRKNGGLTTQESLEMDGGRDVVEELVKHRMLLTPRESEYEDYAVAWHPLTRPRIGVLYLLLTDDCNMKCSYCYIQQGIQPNYKCTVMTPEVARYGIDLFVRCVTRSQDYGIKEPRILLHGGEPLLNFDVLNCALHTIGEYKATGQLPSNTLISLNTNGTLITPEIARTLKQSNVKVAVSLDGWQSIHDTCRAYRTGNGTFRDAVRGLEMLRANGIQPAVSCTIDHHNIDQLEEVLTWIIDTFQVTSISFNPFIASAIWDPQEAKEWANKVARKLIGCYRICRSRGIYEGRVMRQVRAFAEGFILYSSCAGCGQQIVVDPTGNVGVCQAYCGTKQYFVPYHREFDPLDHPYWNEWRFRSPMVMPQCLDCVGLSICGGGCPQSACRQKGSIWELDEIFCVVSKAIVKFLIQDLLEKKLRETITNQ